MARRTWWSTSLPPSALESEEGLGLAHLVGGEWRVYDVVVENISMVNNYRSQFNRVIETETDLKQQREMLERKSAEEEPMMTVEEEPGEYEAGS